MTDMVAEMKVDMVADMEVDKVTHKVTDMFKTICIRPEMF